MQVVFLEFVGEIFPIQADKLRLLTDHVKEHSFGFGDTVIIHISSYGGNAPSAIESVHTLMRLKEERGFTVITIGDCICSLAFIIFCLGNKRILIGQKPEIIIHYPVIPHNLEAFRKIWNLAFPQVEFMTYKPDINLVCHQEDTPMRAGIVHYMQYDVDQWEQSPDIQSVLGKLPFPAKRIM